MAEIPLHKIRFHRKFEYEGQTYRYSGHKDGGLIIVGHLITDGDPDPEQKIFLPRATMVTRP